jgi:hypothetical protein
MSGRGGSRARGLAAFLVTALLGSVGGAGMLACAEPPAVQFSPTGPYEPNAREQEIYQLYEDGKLITARRKVDELLAQEPYSILGHLVLGQVLRQSDGALPQAMQHMGRARELFETRYPAFPLPEDAPRELHRELLFAAAGVAGELEQFEYQLELLDFHDALYKPKLTAEHAWPLMRLHRYDAARGFAKQATESSLDYSRSMGKNALCAIEGEAAQRQPRYDACLAAFDDAATRAASDPENAGPDQRTPLAVHAYNAAMAAAAVLRPDEVERLALEGTRRLDFTPANPWRLLVRLQVDQARIDDALASLQEMLRWRQRQPPYLRDQDRAETDVAQATLLLAVGRTAAGLRLVDRAIARPDRRGLSSSSAEQAAGAHALLRLALRRADAELLAERASWGEGALEGEEAGLLAPVERAGQDLADRERIRNLLDDEARLLATFRVYVLGGLEPVPTWLLGDLVELVGAGVAAVAIERARVADGGDGFSGYHSALEAEVALAQGDETRALARVEQALRELPSTEVLLRARVAAVGARAAADEGDDAAARRYLAQVMQLDPGTIRRQGLSIPVVIRNASSGAVGAEVAARLEGSPRLRPEAGGFGLVIDGEGRQLRLCRRRPMGRSFRALRWISAMRRPSRRPRPRRAVSRPRASRRRASRSARHRPWHARCGHSTSARSGSGWSSRRSICARSTAAPSCPRRPRARRCRRCSSRSPRGDRGPGREPGPRSNRQPDAASRARARTGGLLGRPDRGHALQCDAGCRDPPFFPPPGTDSCRFFDRNGVVLMEKPRRKMR